MAFTDTCAQTCIAGIGFLREMHVDQRSLLPTKHCIMGVTKSRLEILGILLAKVEYAGSIAYTAVYICSGIDDLFLSTKIQSDLKILSDDYPSVSRACTQTVAPNNYDECHKPKDSWSCGLSIEIGQEIRNNSSTLLSCGQKRRYSKEMTDRQYQLCEKIMSCLSVHADSLPFHHKGSKVVRFCCHLLTILYHPFEPISRYDFISLFRIPVNFW